jgi:hypothetical protein
MIIDDLDLMRVAVAPDEADAPLIVDADRPFAFPVPPQRLKPIAGRHPQILELLRVMQDEQLSTGLPLDPTKSGDIEVVEETFRSGVPKRSDHARSMIVTRLFRKTEYTSVAGSWYRT